MSSFQCVENCLGADEYADDNDFVCKKVITAMQFPCPPTTYNANPGQAEGAQCTSAGSGKNSFEILLC
jgi:hypothetical protein